MENSITLGLPRMHVEFGEKRDFLPDFVARLEKLGAQIFLEYGYGVALGFTEADYHAIAPKAIFTSHQEVYQQEILIVIQFLQPVDHVFLPVESAGVHTVQHGHDFEALL